MNQTVYCRPLVGFPPGYAVLQQIGIKLRVLESPDTLVLRLIVGYLPARGPLCCGETGGRHSTRLAEADAVVKTRSHAPGVLKIVAEISGQKVLTTHFCAEMKKG